MTASQLTRLNRSQKKLVANLFSGMKTMRPIVNFVRMMQTIYASKPLSFGSGSSRFSPRVLPSRPTQPFGLVYGTIDLPTACFEAVIRDSFNIFPSRILRSADYNTRSAVNFSSLPGQALQLLDLANGNAIRYGVPTDVIRYSNHKSGQYFSEFVYSEMPDIDGLLYTSRFTENLCVAIYDRAIPKMVSSGAAPKLTKNLLSPILASWNVQVL